MAQSKYFVRNNAQALLRQCGPFQIFHTDSAANLHWPSWKRVLGLDLTSSHEAVALRQQTCNGFMAQRWDMRNGALHDALHDAFGANMKGGYWFDRKEFQWRMFEHTHGVMKLGWAPDTWSAA